jgi:F-type H+-transporting ATPase subunit gamma
MPNLKDLRIRIGSVKSTQKITSAMKMVAASKLRRAQVAAEAGRPYAERMERMMGAMVAALPSREGAPPLVAGTGKADVHLLVVVTADRGLCGGYNGSIIREARRRIRALKNEEKEVKVLCIGRKGRDGLKREFEPWIIDTLEHVTRYGAEFPSARDIAGRLTDLLTDEAFDICTVIYSRFKSAISQEVTVQQLIPFPMPAPPTEEQAKEGRGPRAIFELEPTEEEILAELLPRNLAVQMFRAMLESFASEQGARMTAMDNATRNAGDMIDDLTLTYNRTRQAYITKELIEIISGAEAL